MSGAAPAAAGPDGTMLNRLRRGANTFVAKIFFVILIASFGIWGVSGVVLTGANDWVAEVGDTTVPAADFQRQYARSVQNLSRQIGQPITSDTAAAFGIPQQVLGRMVDEAALTDAAADAGLGIGDTTLAREIADDPALRPEGAESFDRGWFNMVLRENGLTEQDYVEERRSLNLRNQLAQGLAGGMTTPEALVEAVHRFQNDVRVVEYVRLGPSSIQPTPVPSDSDLASWYEDRKGDYRAPETRTVSFLLVTPESIADPATVTDEEARAEYQRTRQAFGTPERRRIDQILFPSLADAEAAAAKIAGGSTFEQIAEERGLFASDVSLGLVTRADVIDPAIAETAFGLAAPGVTPPIDARFGGALVRVAEIVPESVQPFEAVAQQIRTQIAARRAQSGVLELHDEVEDARAGGATLAEIAERFTLERVTVTTSEAGEAPDGSPVDFRGADAILAAAFASEEGVDNDPVQVGPRGFAWFEVEKVTPSADQPLSAVRDRVVADWTDEAIRERLAAKATEIVEAVRIGGDLAVLGLGAGGTVGTAENITRNTDVPDLGRDGVIAAFSGPEGHVADVEGQDGSHVVLKVTRSVVPAFFPEAADSVTAKRQFREELESSLLALYTEAVKNERGLRINQQVMQSVIGSGTQ